MATLPNPSSRSLYCLAVVVDIEGGWKPATANDPGGETKYGVTKRYYPQLDIKNLTVQQATNVLYRDYWMVVKGDQLPQPLDLMVLDAAVNQGQPTAIRLLQKVCGVTQDGIVGQETLSAAKAWMTDEYLVQRALLYTQTANFSSNGHSWFMRLFRLKNR